VLVLEEKDRTVGTLTARAAEGENKGDVVAIRKRRSQGGREQRLGDWSSKSGSHRLGKEVQSDVRAEMQWGYDPWE